VSAATDIHGSASFSWREAALWGGAALLVAAIYVGAGLTLLRASPPAPEDTAAPEAIMVDLAPAPQAPAEPEKEMAVNDKDSKEVKAEPVPDPQPPEETPPPEVKTPELPSLAPPVIEPDPPTPKPQDTPEPPQPAPPPDPDPTPVQPTPPAALAEVPLPAPRPASPPPTKHQKPEERPTKAHKPAPSRASKRASISARQAERAAAAETSEGVQSSEAPARWQARLLAHLERRKRYPEAARSRREEGTASVRFRIDGSGNVLSASISRSSGHSDLDAAVLDMVRRASPVPAPPPGVNRTIVVPIRFDLR